MRKITNEVVHHGFQVGHKVSKGNTQSTGDALYLYGNRIARRHDGKLYISLCGWDTVTTKERLNAIYGVDIRRVRGVTMLNGKPWDGNEVCLDDWVSQ